jgi:hypothetical protein
MPPPNGLAIISGSGGANVAGEKGIVADSSLKSYDLISVAKMKLSSMAESDTKNVPLTGAANGAGETVVNV